MEEEAGNKIKRDQKGTPTPGVDIPISIFRSGVWMRGIGENMDRGVGLGISPTGISWAIYTEKNSVTETTF